MFVSPKSLSVALFASVISAVSAASGDATWFNPGQGACGSTSKSTDFIVALATPDFAGGEHCWKHITVNFNGVNVDATVVDECPGCAQGSIDLSPSAFSSLTSLGAGRIKVTWGLN